MSEKIKEEMHFNEDLLAEVRQRFCRIDTDADGSRRLFFENAGGSLRLKSAVEISDELNRYPDCFARDHKSSKVLHQYEVQGREDFRTLINAKTGAVLTSLTATMLMFDIVGPIVEYGKGTNIVTSVLEHPSVFDACRFYGEKFGKEVRVAGSNPRTGGIDAAEVLSLVDENTLMVNVISASNMTGAVTDIETIAAEARKINPDIFIVTDAVQHAPHGLLDVEKAGIDGMNIAPYKFFGNRGIAFGYVSDRVKNLPHKQIFADGQGHWEMGSIVPAHYAVMSEMVNYIAWIGAHFTEKEDKRSQVEEGMKRIRLQEQALLHRLLYGADGNSGLLFMDGADTFFDYSELEERDLILAMKLKDYDLYETTRAYEERGIIVYERAAASEYSRRMVESFGLSGIIRVSPLHCNTMEEIDEFLDVTRAIIAQKR